MQYQLPIHGIEGTAVGVITCDTFLACDTSRTTVTVSIVPTDGTPTGSLCDLSGSWCVMGGSFWSSAFAFDCSFFDGSTWYGSKRFEFGGTERTWLFKVVDAGTRGDELGIETTRIAPEDDGRCGAGAVRARPLHFGDFTVF
jgi:hypothetical protein